MLTSSLPSKDQEDVGSGRSFLQRKGKAEVKRQIKRTDLWVGEEGHVAELHSIKLGSGDHQFYREE